MRYGGEASNEFNQGYEVNQAMMSDDLALMAYELKLVRSMLIGAGHVDSDATREYCGQLIDEVINKLEGL